jgi:hypothetical protein
MSDNVGKTRPQILSPRPSLKDILWTFHGHLWTFEDIFELAKCLDKLACQQEFLSFVLSEDMLQTCPGQVKLSWTKLQTNFQNKDMLPRCPGQMTPSQLHYTINQADHNNEPPFIKQSL